MSRLNRIAMLSAACCTFAGVALGAAPPTYRATMLGDTSTGRQIMVMYANRAGWSTGWVYSGDLPDGVYGFIASPEGDLQVLDLPDAYWIDIAAINDHGVVVGTARVQSRPTDLRYIFRCSADGACESIEAVGGTHGQVIDINERGEIVGSWADAVTGSWHAFKYSDEAGWVTLNDSGNTSNYVSDINDRGEVVGTTWISGVGYRSWYWRDGELSEIGTFGGDISRAYYINNDGVVVGSANTAAGDVRAFRWTKEGGIEALPLTGGAERSEALWITDSGLVGGVQSTGSMARAFVYSEPTGTIDLSTEKGTAAWDAPNAMNREGVTVFRTLDTDTYEITPFVYSPAFGLHDINDLIEGDPWFRIDEPAYVTECGEIVAQSSSNVELTQFHNASFLLTPIWPSDINRDGDTDLADYAVLQRNIGMQSDALRTDGDIDGDGDVDMHDASALIEALRAPCR